MDLGSKASAFDRLELSELDVSGPEHSNSSPLVESAWWFLTSGMVVSGSSRSRHSSIDDVAASTVRKASLLVTFQRHIVLNSSANQRLNYALANLSLDHVRKLQFEVSLPMVCFKAVRAEKLSVQGFVFRGLGDVKEQ